jgi:hypothetical protein
LGCSHFELGRLVRERIAAMPVRIDGQIFWHEDEARAAAPKCRETLAYWRRSRRPSDNPAPVAAQAAT